MDISFNLNAKEGDVREEVGTLDQQLLAVERFLAIPRRVREDFGRDVLWEHVHGSVLSGATCAVPDQVLRESVMEMRELQRRLIRRDFGDRGRSALIQLLRERERDVDNLLKDDWRMIG